MNNKENEQGLTIFVDMINKKVGRVVNGKKQTADLPIDLVFPDTRTFTYSNFRDLATTVALDAGLISSKEEIDTWFWEMSQTPEYDYFIRPSRPAVFSFKPVKQLPFDRATTPYIVWSVEPYEGSGIYVEGNLYPPDGRPTNISRVGTWSKFDKDGDEWDYLRRRAQEQGHETKGSWYFNFPHPYREFLQPEEHSDDEDALDFMDSGDAPPVIVCAFIEAPIPEEPRAAWAPDWS